MIKRISLIAIVAIGIGALFLTSISAVPSPQASAQTEKCISSQSPSTGGFKTAAGSARLCEPLTGQGLSQAIQACKSSGDLKCSGSQTGFGAFPKLP